MPPPPAEKNQRNKNNPQDQNLNKKRECTRRAKFISSRVHFCVIFLVKQERENKSECII